MAQCTVCSRKVEEKKIKNVKIKGKVKKICEECVTAIKGLA